MLRQRMTVAGNFIVGIVISNIILIVIGKSELSAFFRKVDHKNYRECRDQVLRNFLKGLQLEYRRKKELN